jgi:hypothetical protein
MWLCFVRSYAALVALCAVLSAPTAHACKCAAPDSPTAALASSAAVFEGQVTKVTPIDEHDIAVELKVVRRWKNADVEKILVRTHSDQAACGVGFESDQSYLVYAQGPATDALPGLQVSRCGRTRPINEAVDDIAELGMGVVPVSPTIHDNVTDNDDNAQNTHNPVASQHDRPAAGGCASCTVGHARNRPQPSPWWAGLGLSVVSVALFRYGRSRWRS